MASERKPMILIGKYRDVDVYLDPNRPIDFYADTGAACVRAGSWDTLTKKLDEAIAFQPIEVLREVGEHINPAGYQKIRLIGLAPMAASRDKRWIVEGDKHALELYTPLYPAELESQVAALLGNIREYAEKEAALKEQREAVREQLHALRIPRPE